VYDTMQRLGALTMNGQGVVGGTAYNAANQPIQTVFTPPAGGVWENRGYNQLNQLEWIQGYNSTATMVDAPNLNVVYNYSPTNNNGQIVSMTDGLRGQTVNYTYDALRRLTSAATAVQGPAGSWLQSYTYDGFGNMTSKTGAGAVFTGSADPNTNRLVNPDVC
jgi:YD repeat-containing protein